MLFKDNNEHVRERKSRFLLGECWKTKRVVHFI